MKFDFIFNISPFNNYGRVKFYYRLRVLSKTCGIIVYISHKAMENVAIYETFLPIACKASSLHW